jgi:hypothetical protein
MNKRISILLAFVLVLSLSACEQFLEVDLPGQEPKLVLNGLLENTDTIKVFLSKSRGILEGNQYDRFESVTDSEVYIKLDNGAILPFIFKEQSNPFESFSYYYLTGFDFGSGDRFEIFAESDGFQPVNSQVVFPQFIPIKEISFQNLGPSGSLENHDLFEFTLKFEDPSTKDFYELGGQISGKSTIQENSYYGSELYPIPVNPAYEKDFNSNSNILFNDVLLRSNEAEMVFRTTLPRYYELEVSINLAHVSESYYRYYASAELQSNNEGDILSQPVLVYTNIQNGLGIFSAKNRDQKIITLTLED